MRKIELQPDFHVTFKGQDEGFDLGVEVGATSALMLLGLPTFDRTLSHAATEQLRDIAYHLGYVLVPGREVSGNSQVTIRRRSERPRLHVVG